MFLENRVFVENYFIWTKKCNRNLQLRLQISIELNINVVVKIRFSTDYSALSYTAEVVISLIY